MANEPSAQPKEGFYCKGAFAEGFDWNVEGGHLVDAEPMKLISHMPAIHFKPKEGKVSSNGLLLRFVFLLFFLFFWCFIA